MHQLRESQIKIKFLLLINLIREKIKFTDFFFISETYFYKSIFYKSK